MKVESSYFSIFLMRERPCAHARAKIIFSGDFQWISNIQSKISARVCARWRAHDKIWKVWTFSFHWKRINKFGQKGKILQKKMKMYMYEIRKKRLGLCPAVIAQIEDRLAKILQNWRSTSWSSARFCLHFATPGFCCKHVL